MKTMSLVLILVAFGKLPGYNINARECPMLEIILY